LRALWTEQKLFVFGEGTMTRWTSCWFQLFFWVKATVTAMAQSSKNSNRKPAMFQSEE
jgi:hypothetical protein